MMRRLISIVFVLAITSLYYFPVVFAHSPMGLNTKEIFAVAGLLFYVYDSRKTREIRIHKAILAVTIMSFVISLIAWFSIIYNNTNDTSYCTYFASMLVWLFASYFFVRMIGLVHGEVNIELICNYVVTICVLQCISAMVIDNVVWFRSIVNRSITSFAFIPGAGNELYGFRLYGIGAALDVAGARFSAALVMLAIVVHKHVSESRADKVLWLYLVAFAIITVIGNMIARTTTVGVLLCIAYWIYVFRPQFVVDFSSIRFWAVIILVIMAAVPIAVYFYNHDEVIREYIRFGFEGFFSLAEKGSWEVSSNDILESMYRFPDNAKTWIIGDGYMNNPRDDMNYVGHVWKGFYMGTDVGYLRFIYYFGLVGTIAFVIMFAGISWYGIKYLKGTTFLFLMLLATNLIVWFKVSSDIFVAFAPFLSLMMIQSFEEELS